MTAGWLFVTSGTNRGIAHGVEARQIGYETEFGSRMDAANQR